MRWYGALALTAVVIVGGLTAIVPPAVPMAVAGLVMMGAAMALWGVHGLLVLALAATWLGRAGLLFGLGSGASFADFPLVLLALVVALGGRDRGPGGVGFLVVLGLALLLSAVANFTDPVRALVGAALLLEPFAALAALLATRRHAARERLLLGVVAFTIVVQFPVALYQWATLGGADDVKGTLFEAGAGHHVLGGGMLLAMMAYAGLRWGKPSVFLVFLACLAVNWLADAKQVLAVVPLAVGVLYLKGRGIPRPARALTAGVAIFLAALPTLYVLSQTAVFGHIGHTAATGGGKIGVARQLVDDLNESPKTALFGLGAGESVSRLASLTTGGESQPGLPLKTLRLESSVQAEAYQRVSTAFGYVGDTSFSAAQSSLLGVLGDYGWIGLLVYLGVVADLCRRLWWSTHPLSGAALAGWVIAIPLGLVFDWLEQPPFMLLLALITGLALTQSSAPSGQELTRVGGHPANWRHERQLVVASRPRRSPHPSEYQAEQRPWPPEKAD